MNKTELVSQIATKAGVAKRAAEDMLDAFTDSVMEAVASGDKVQLVGFGTFESRIRAARQGINPQTRETIEIPEVTVPAFEAGRNFKDKVKGADPEPA